MASQILVACNANVFCVRSRAVYRIVHRVAYAVIDEASDRAKGHVRGLMDYLRLARLTAGPYPCFFPIEMDLDISDEVMAHPSMDGLHRLAAESLVLGNVSRVFNYLAITRHLTEHTDRIYTPTTSSKQRDTVVTTLLPLSWRRKESTLTVHSIELRNIMVKFCTNSKRSVKHCPLGVQLLTLRSRRMWRDLPTSSVGSTVGRSRPSDILGLKVGRFRSRGSSIYCQK
jgi:Terpene synthase family 2, C-terminal metal binding